MNKIQGLPDGKLLMKMTQDTFDTPVPTAEQLRHVMVSLVPSLYAMEHHSVKGHPLTFNIPNRNRAEASAHRPLMLGAL